jgi:hypothetical protein
LGDRCPIDTVAVRDIIVARVLGEEPLNTLIDARSIPADCEAKVGLPRVVWIYHPIIGSLAAVFRVLTSALVLIGCAKEHMRIFMQFG